MNGTTYTFKPNSNGTTCTKTAQWTPSTSSSVESVILPGASRNGYIFD
jgi:hypothetical protein